MSVFDSYKPFRNTVSALGIEDSLRVIWAYSQYLQFRGFRFPLDIQVDRQFLNLTPPQQWISEWHLEILAKEIILNGKNFPNRKRSLRSWPVLASIINKLKTLEDDIHLPPSSTNRPLIMLNRIAHQQFIWQTNKPNGRSYIRHFKIYNTTTINTICSEKIGMSIPDLYLCGMAFWGSYMRHPATTYPISSEIQKLTMSKIDSFLRFGCCTIPELRLSLTAEQRYDNAFFYSYNPLRACPLVRIRNPSGEIIVSPLPTLLFWRFTGGLYYDLVNDPRFANEFGKSFQRYVGESIEQACPGAKIHLLAEASFGSKKQRKDTVDWIAVDHNSALFIECKAKRLSWGAKIAFDDLEPLERDIDFMADAVIQVYKTIRDYRNGHYPHFHFEPSRKIFPIVVTLENWHLFGQTLLDLLRESIMRKIESIDIPARYMDEMPFSIWHISELERGMQIVNETGIQTFMDGKLHSQEMREWEWHSYMLQAFGNRHKNKQLFQHEYESIFSNTGL